jgi:polar amino acid transport system substrate-binding protein
MARAKKFLRALPILLLLAISSARADVLDDVLERKTLRVGVSEFTPWTLRTKSGELIGFEIDLARQLAEDMGVSAEFTVYQWNDIIGALQDGEIDVIAGGMAITPARALQVNFSRPVATSGVGIATNTKMTADIETLADLNRKSVTITTVSDSLAAGVARRLFTDANLQIFAEPGPAETEVVEGRAHAYLATMAEVQFLALRNPGVVDLPISEPLLASSEALAIRRGEQAFLNFLNAWVTARQSDKWLATTHDYWFGTLDWMERIDDE